MSLKEEGQEGKIKLNETASDDLKISLFSNLFTHLFKDASIATGLLLQSKYLFFPCFSSLPIDFQSILVFGPIIPSEKLNLLS